MDELREIRPVAAGSDAAWQNQMSTAGAGDRDPRRQRRPPPRRPPPAAAVELHLSGGQSPESGTAAVSLALQHDPGPDAPPECARRRLLSARDFVRPRQAASPLDR